MTQEACWIWYPGEFEAYHHSRISLLRQERGTMCPPVWKMDGWYTAVTFQKTYTLAEPGQVTLHADGGCYCILDGREWPDAQGSFTLPAGTHTFAVRVGNLAAPPALLVSGAVPTDATWQATNMNGVWKAAGHWSLLADPAVTPSAWRLPTRPMAVASLTEGERGQIADFGKETIGYLRFTPLTGQAGKLYYGESLPECLSDAHCEVCEAVGPFTPGEPVRMPVTRALRYVRFAGLKVADVSLDYEALPLSWRGSFTCDDALVNRMHEIGMYTLELTSREFFLDGIKRDRWVWSGDSIQSVMMNHYAFFDKEIARRTLRALRGKDPYDRHMNTIVDYTLYWFQAIAEDYQYTGDPAFMVEMYPLMKTAMDFCLSRCDEQGFIQGQPGDWIFIDWAAVLPKDGDLCFEQLLLIKALKSMAQAAELAGADGAPYAKRAERLTDKVMEVFWDEARGTLQGNVVDGAPSNIITRHAPMFAILLDLLDDEKRARVTQSTLLSDAVPAITTPYMRFYEMDALCRVGEHEEVLRQMRDYWGGMIALGATAFWEQYDPKESGDEHLAMYGRPFGRSLCHAWGASPVYLLGRHFLGVTPDAPGYAAYTVRPHLGGLKWMQGAVPTPDGDVRVRMDGQGIDVTGCTCGEGTLIFTCPGTPRVIGGEALPCADGYQVQVPAGATVQVRW